MRCIHRAGEKVFIGDDRLKARGCDRDKRGAGFVADAMKKALAARTFGTRYVRTLIDQSRFARGPREPPEPIVTGNTTADSVVVETHALETYDALLEKPQNPENQGPDSITPDPSTSHR